MINSILNQVRLYAAIISFTLMLTAVSGCSTANYGQLKSNMQVTQAFQSYQILPNYKYFYRGTYSRPIAIAGIRPEFELNSKLWVEIDLKSKDFKALIDKVALQGSGGTTQPWGFNISDHSGRDAGVWYSAIRAAVVDVQENGQIVNLSPIGFVTRGNQQP
jgi:hypothetical protein